jgi:hypothetical protein
VVESWLGEIAYDGRGGVNGAVQLGAGRGLAAGLTADDQHLPRCEQRGGVPRA